MEIWFKINATASLIVALMLFIAATVGVKRDGYFAFFGGLLMLFAPVSWVVYFVVWLWL